MFGIVRIAALGLAACSLAALAACSSAGPPTRDLFEAAKADEPTFALVDLSEPSLDVVSSWHRPMFSAVYGDYRGPKVQKVDVGDTVHINIWETGAGGLFTTPIIDRSGQATRVSSIPEQVVARDGTVNVPYAGRIRVAGKTTPEIESQIVQRLAGKTADPQAMVSLTRAISNTVTVTGEVTAGARVPLSPGGDKLLEVIATAGGIRGPVHDAFITLSREGNSLSVPLQAILSNTKENIYLRPGDVVTVYRQPQSFTAFGATGRQAMIGFEAGGITLDEALGKAGGLLDDVSDAKGVFVLRYEPISIARQYPKVPSRLLSGSVVPVAYRIDMSEPTALFRARRFAMRDKDILYVSHAPVTEAHKIFRMVGMLTQPAITGLTISRYAP